MNTPNYKTIPTPVYAIQFVDTAENFEEISRVLQGAIYFSQGSPSIYRTKSELVGGETRDDAPAFMLVYTRSGMARVDKYDWIVQYDEARVTPYKPLEFARLFIEDVSYERI